MNPRVSPPPGAPRPRRALSQRGPILAARGEAEDLEVLRAAWAACGSDDERWTHGFHAYPARMHPGIARVVCEAWARAGDVVFDPFCGSGTVIVEARARGATTWGVDLNPLAIRLATLKSSVVDGPTRARWQAAIAAISEASLARVAARLAVPAPVSAAERSWYAPHVLRELAGLHAEITAWREPDARELALLVLSAIVIKFSRQRADTSAQAIDKSIGKGAPSRFFARKADELLARLADYAAACPERSPVPRLALGDARAIESVLPALRGVDLVLTSPPYVGTYDYVDHHGRRMAWLGIDARGLERGEMGARRNYHDRRGSRAARARWDQEIVAVLRPIAARLGRKGRAVWLVGDGEIGGNRIAADAQLERLAEVCELRVRAVVSQGRRDYTGGPDRAEHLVVLERAAHTGGNRSSSQRLRRSS